MKQQLEDRLQALRAEYDSGQETLAAMKVEQARIERTLLRISGAIQVLEELLSEPSEAGVGRHDNLCGRLQAVPQSDVAAGTSAREDERAAAMSGGGNRPSNAGRAATVA